MKHSLVIIMLLSLLTCNNEKTTNENIADAKEATPTILFKKLESAKIFAGSLLRVDSFPSKYITPRPIDVWLPENYSEEKKYAVLYMHDGQMLFDSTTTWNKQEWKVDEWATQLVDEEKVEDFIVVGIHNIPDIRWQDLFPEKALNFLSEADRTNIKNISGKLNKTQDMYGNKYLKFLVEELKPAIDKTYSVFTDREHTFVMGSSMGGLMSMYAISEYPNVFRGAACVSTHWPGAGIEQNSPLPDAIFKYVETNLPKAGTHYLYFDYGNKTLDQYYPQYAPRVDAILEAKGYTQSDAKNLFFQGTDHSENSWNQRLDRPLVFLLGK